ncbi:MAG: DUF386 family protein [Phycisphaera sp.]|nr:DUF386 family protein [Phycisphaera sp.]
MLMDELSRAAAGRELGGLFARALAYLRQTDFSDVADGRYAIEGEDLFAMVQRYEPRAMGDVVWESHRKYADVQFVASGVEWMGWRKLVPDLPVKTPYDPERDAVFYDLPSPGDAFKVTAGEFVVFMPEDVHSPSLWADGSRKAVTVCKVVVKVRVG